MNEIILTKEQKVLLLNVLKCGKITRSEATFIFDAFELQSQIVTFQIPNDNRN